MAHVPTHTSCSYTWNNAFFGKTLRAIQLCHVHGRQPEECTSISRRQEVDRQNTQNVDILRQPRGHTHPSSWHMGTLFNRTEHVDIMGTMTILTPPSTHRTYVGTCWCVVPLDLDASTCKTWRWGSEPICCVLILACETISDGPVSSPPPFLNLPAYSPRPQAWRASGDGAMCPGTLLGSCPLKAMQHMLAKKPVMWWEVGVFNILFLSFFFLGQKTMLNLSKLMKSAISQVTTWNPIVIVINTQNTPPLPACHPQPQMVVIGLFVCFSFLF